jgi:glycosyltransferase involved in cell wall biosynthesis
MDSPKVSVIIPAYNGAKYLGEAIQSVLDQTNSNLELLVVDDVSTDDTLGVVRQFDDNRLIYLAHEVNRGAVAARETGVRASTGEIIAFLDQDDLFHPEKLKTHTRFLEEHSDVGVTYNARFEVEAESRAVRGIWQPPAQVVLADFVLGFPFSPSDTVARREFCLREDIWDQSYVYQGKEMIFNGAEIIFGGRLALAGCRFASVGRTLNYRRYHPRRVFSDLSGRCRAECTCQEMILRDPRCPQEVRNLRTRALMNTYLTFAYYAFAQNETEVGHSFLRQAVQLNPLLVEGKPCGLVRFIVENSAADRSVDLDGHLETIFDQIPPELASLSAQLGWSLTRGYLIRETEAILWDHPENRCRPPARGEDPVAPLDDAFVNTLTSKLLIHEREFGSRRTEKVLQKLCGFLKKVAGRNCVRRLKASCAVNQAFQRFRSGTYAQVPIKVFQTVFYDPKYLFNRGVWAVLFQSTTHIRLTRLIWKRL